MKYLITFLLTLSLTEAQDDNLNRLVSEFFSENATQDPFQHLEEVTSSKPSGFGAIEKCGQGSDQGVHICVPYYDCDSVTKMVVHSRSSGFGTIDIRFGANECEHYLDVCCGVPKATDREPEVREPVSSSSSTSIPRVTSTSPTPPNTSRPRSTRCGIRNPNGIDFRITGNKDGEAEYGEFPWMMAILRANYNPQIHENLAICGGSLIAPNVVVTGGHCVADLQTSDYLVRAGEWDTQTTKERLPHQERTVIQAIVHEHYAPRVVYNNIALLILNRPFDMADNIGTICLPAQDEKITSSECLASGWGKNSFGKAEKYQVILKKIKLPMVDFHKCEKALQKTRLGSSFILHHSFICAGGEQGKDTCTGDGGGPLVCPDSRDQERYVQAGIVSWGIGCGDRNIPGVYANVAKYRNWIDEQLLRLNINSDSYSI
ncbi:hypothetical protein ABEB36_005387 [Hypothenemus hampei]|uniref:Phenoloxidase-activating factor 2 n=1 Tax=Hypothenemus hampei TaxID=57062 RepID=A0ABD1F140_HYPHA